MVHWQKRVLSFALVVSFVLSVCVTPGLAEDLDTATVTGVTIDSAALSFSVGQSQQLAATVTYSNGNSYSTATSTTFYPVTWESSDDAVAVVDDNGLVTAVNVGDATITATSVDDSSASGTCEITVSEAAKTLKVTAVTYDEAATDSTAVTTVSSVTLLWGGVTTDTVTLDSGTENATLTVDGVQYDIIQSYLDGTVYNYTDTDITGIAVTDKGSAGSGSSKFDGEGVSITYYTRAAAWITDEGLQSEFSVSDALVGGGTDSDSSDGVNITSLGGFFSGYYINSGQYVISDLDMTLEGNGGDDFQGWGAGITVEGSDSEVTVDGSYIDTTGVIRTAIWAGGSDSQLDVTDSVVVAHNDDEAVAYSTEDNYAVPMMERVPFALGLEGNIRATNVLGSATASYADSIVVSGGWGALSTDSGQSGTKALDVANVLSGIGTLEVAQDGQDYTATKEVNGVTYGFSVYQAGEGSGYVTYADSGVYDEFDNVEFYAPDYIGIIASGTSSMYFTDSYGYSDRIGFMSHQTAGGTLDIEGGAFDIADTFIMVKSGAANSGYLNVDVDGATINLFGDNAQSGVLLQLVENDDAGGPGTTEYTIDDSTLDEIKALSSGGTITSTVANFSNMDVTGDIYNSIYKYEQDLDVTFTDSTITGIISSSVAYHVDEDGGAADGTTIYAAETTDPDDSTGDYLYIGRLVNEASETVRNGVNLVLDGQTTWNVTGTSYLTSLSIGDDATVTSSSGYTLTMTVDGTETEIAAGEYSGTIVLTASLDLGDNSLTVDAGESYEVAETTTLTALYLEEGASLTAPDGKLLTLMVDNIEKEIKTGTTYTGDVVLTVTDYLSDSAIGSYTARGAEPYRLGLLITPDGISDNSVTEVLASGVYDATEANGLSITSETPEFTGVMVYGSDDDTRLSYTISDTSIYSLSDTDGTADEVSDFTGLGASVSAYGNTLLTLDNVYIHTTGVAKPALFTDSGADAIIKGSVFLVEGGYLYDDYINSADQTTMVAPPWVLGITGNARATNLMGDYSTNTFIDSEFTSTAWGVLSTDACSNVVMTVINSSLSQLYTEEDDYGNASYSGYGTYAIGDAKEFFYGVSMDVGTYATIITGGYVYYTDYESGESVTVRKDDSTATTSDSPSVWATGEEVASVSSESAEGTIVSTVNSGAFGVMWHGAGAAVLDEGTVFNTKNAVFLVKAGAAVVTVDDATLNPTDGVLVQLIGNDDSEVGVADATTVAFNTTFSETAGYHTGSTSGSLTATFTNGDYEGDMYNGDSIKTMDVTLGEGAELTGSITSTEYMHVWMELTQDEDGDYYYEYMTDENGDYIQATDFTISEYYNLGHVVNNPASGNDAQVTLTDDAVWNVTGTSYLTSLNIGDGATVTAPAGYTLTMTVDGTETEIAAGEYSGIIVLTLTAESTDVDTVPVTSITVTGSNSKTSVTKGKTLQMIATILPTDATDSSVTWHVTNGTGKATIDSDGLLTAVSVGTVTVTATANDDSGVTGTMKITVKAKSSGGGSSSSSGSSSATTMMTMIAAPAAVPLSPITRTCPLLTGIMKQ